MNRMPFLLVLAALWQACATVVTPTGGPKDTTPPQPVSMVPEGFSTRFTSKTIQLVFDEYVQVKNPQQEWTISPEMEFPEYQVKGKMVLIKFVDSLASNTTYTINFGESIVDLNEGNPLSQFTYVFSTGTFIDSLSIQGLVVPNYLQGLPEKLKVFAYTQSQWNGDSTLLNSAPNYLGKVSLDGSFSLPYLGPQPLQLVLVEDKNRNLRAENEEVKGFLSQWAQPNTDSAIVEMLAFDPVKPLKYKGGKQVDFRTYAIEFNRDIYAWDSLSLSSNHGMRWSVDGKNIKVTALAPFDTMLIELQSPEGPQSMTWALQAMDTTEFELSLSKALPLLPIDSVVIEGNFFVTTWDSTRTSLRVDSLIQQPQFRLKNQRLVLDRSLTEGESFLLVLDSAAVHSDLNQANDSTAWMIQVANANQYGTVKIAAQTDSLVQVELLNDKDELVFSGKFVQGEVFVPWLKPGSYTLRAYHDLNANGRFDTGNFLKRKQPEPCQYYKEKVQIRANWDLELAWTNLRW